MSEKPNGLIYKLFAQPARVAFSRLSCRYRKAPDFILIGAQKSGTTSLFNYLAQHPDLFPSRKKEVHYFDGGIQSDIDQYALGSCWYRSHFPLISHLAAGQLVYEASPMYLYHPLCAERIYQELPRVKMIAVLRDPVERAISNYFHVKKRGFESLDILDAFIEEESRLQVCVEQEDYKNDAYRRYSYKSRGLYHHQLQRYLNFFPEDQLLVLSSESLFSEPESSLRKVFHFLGVDDQFHVADLKARNVGENKNQVDGSVYDYLKHYFSEPNQRLYDMLGEDFHWQ